MTAATALLVALFWASGALGQPGCQTETAYNPIAEDYPMSITGVMNGTFSIAFLPRDTAESLVPDGYEFLDDLYQRDIERSSQLDVLVLLKAVRIHDIRSPDDLWRNDNTLISFELPYIDALGDGRTPFRYPYAQFISVGTPSYVNDVAERYGVPHIIRSVYDPECDAYVVANESTPSVASLRGIPADGSMRNIIVSATRQLTREARPFSTDALKRIVGQSRFGVTEEGLQCGGNIIYWDVEVGFDKLIETVGAVTLSGEFEALDPLWTARWNRVYGVRAGTAFIEEDFVDCDALHWAISPEG